MIPSITHATWWNPSTWKVFNKVPRLRTEKTITTSPTPTNTDSQVSEVKNLKKEVEELKKRLLSPTLKPKPSVSVTPLYTPRLNQRPIPTSQITATPRTIAPKQLIYSELEKAINQINDRFEKQYQEIMARWDNMQNELKPIQEAQDKLWAEEELKCPTGVIALGQIARECDQMMIQYGRYTDQQNEISRKYGFATNTQPTQPRYLPKATTWYLESGPDGMSGSVWSTSGGRMNYECLGTSCRISSY